MKQFSLQEKSWILYDVGNSAFILVVVTTLMPIFFKDVASQGLPHHVSTANWAFANVTSSSILAVLAPVLGSFADYRGRKKFFFGSFLAAGLIFTVLLTTIGRGDWLHGLIIFVMARVGYAGANLFYDAFLVDVAAKKRMDWVSSSGYGWGYIGSVIPFLLAIGLVLYAKSSAPTDSLPVWAVKAAFLLVALWWLLFSVPMLKNVRQIYFIPPESNPVQASFKRLLRTFKEIKKYREAFLFLIAYFFYIDGVNTIITMATAYGREIGLDITQLILAILMTQVVAFPCVLVYGRLARRFSARNMLVFGIGIYTLLTFLGFFLPVMPTREAKLIMFWILAFLVGTSQGGIQALSRSFFGKLIPTDRSAEFFGFYNIFGKFATISGPFLVGVFGRLTGHTRYGLLSIVALFIIGAVILLRIDARVDADTP